MTCVALGEPGVPLICWAGAGNAVNIAATVSTVELCLKRLFFMDVFGLI